MIDNFVNQDVEGDEAYFSYNQVFTHESGHSIYLGDMSAANNIQFLTNTKIGLVITAATNMTQLQYDNRIKHVVYNLLDSKTENMLIHFSSFYTMIEDNIRNNNILVHCFAGISRSATLVISYLMKKRCLSFKQAIAEVRKYRPKVLPNLGFERQLKEYQKVLSTEEIAKKRIKVTKTSESKKHNSQKMQQPFALPEIFACGKTIVRPKKIDISPIHPSSQMQSRNVRALNLAAKAIKDEGLGSFKSFQSEQLIQPISNRIPLKSYKKRSISMSTNVPIINLHKELQICVIAPIEAYKLAGNKIQYKKRRIYLD